MASDEYNIVDINPKSSSVSSNDDTNCSDTSTPNIDEGKNSPCNTHDIIDISETLDHCENFDDNIDENLVHKTTKVGDQNDSPSTSRCDAGQLSLESSDLNNWIRSGTLLSDLCLLD